MHLHVTELVDSLVVTFIDVVHARSQISDLKLHVILQNDSVCVQFCHFLVDLIEHIEFVVRFVDDFLEFFELGVMALGSSAQLVEFILVLYQPVD
jgi:hypothetical protein